MAALTAALMGLSALSSYASQKKQGEYTAGQLDVNAGLADQNAADAIARGKEAAAREALQTRGLLGSQRVAGAAQGIETDTGSMANIQSDTASMGELDRLTILHNAQREAFGFKADAAIARAQGEQVRQASRTQARGTLLTAASNLWAMRPPTAPKSGYIPNTTIFGKT
jgi:hypothetical protein